MKEMFNFCLYSNLIGAQMFKIILYINLNMCCYEAHCGLLIIQQHPTLISYKVLNLITARYMTLSATFPFLDIVN